MGRLPRNRMRVHVEDDLRERRPRSAQIRRGLHGKVARWKAAKLGVRVVESDRDGLRKLSSGRSDIEDLADRAVRTRHGAELDRDRYIRSERTRWNGDRDAVGADHATLWPNV